MHFANDIIPVQFFNENSFVFVQISRSFVCKGSIDNKPALVQIMAWHWTDIKPFSEPMMVYFTDAYMCHSASMS